MSVRFVTSDNKYVQYFLVKDEWSASEGDWEKLNLETELSQLGQVIELFGFGTHWRDVSETDWQVGYKMYNTVEKVIKTCGAITKSGGVSSWSDLSTPRTDCIYICKGSLYVYNEDDFIDITLMIEYGSGFARAVSQKFASNSLTQISYESGYLNVTGEIVSSSVWRTNKYDITNEIIVFVSGRDTAISALAALYDENDNVLKVFDIITSGESANLTNVFIPVSGATYLKVCGHISYTPELSCKTILQGEIANKQYVDDGLKIVDDELKRLENKIPEISIQKTIDIE